jgi:hypothetical protein
MKDLKRNTNVEQAIAALRGEMEAIRAEVREMTDEQQLQRFEDAYEVTVSKLLLMAVIIQEREAAGKDMTRYKIGVLNMFHRVAHLQLWPAAFVRYKHHPRLLRRVADLPLADQVPLGDDCALEVLVFTAADEPTHKLIDPLHMEEGQIRQVFAKGSLRNLAQQRAWLEEKRTQRRLTTVTEADSGVIVDRRRRRITINQPMVLTQKELLHLLGQFDD